MKYPHWFCFLIANDDNWTHVPCAVTMVSREQAQCAIFEYVNSRKDLYFGSTNDLVKYECEEDLLADRNINKTDLIILSDDEHGHCVAFSYCDEGSNTRCKVDFFQCKCF